MHVTGSCHCGQVQYEAELDPAVVTVCHCTDCQRMTGGPYRVTGRAPAASFKLLSGTLKSYLKTTADSGNKRVHSFCPECGSPVHVADPVDPQNYGLRIGCLDQRGDLPPRRQIWCQSALPWSKSVEGVPAFDRQ